MDKKIKVSKKPKNDKPILAETKLNTPIAHDDFPIVGIGASAGGLEALELFFKNMPENCAMAFVVIQHLDPTHVCVMPELLQRNTSMKVIQASDYMKVEPNCVFVIPPNKSLSILNGALHLLEPLESRGLRLPVDYFFRSLADDKLDKSIGIILSGMGSDGCLGLKSIKEKNGLVLVQDPASAKFDGMPRSAIGAVTADIVAPAEELPAKLIALLKAIPTAKEHQEIDDKYKSNLDKIIILLRDKTGHDFSLYKKNTLLRRIERRKGLHEIEKIQNYVRYLQENPHEVDLLFKELLIGVTSFFRDSAVWEKLKESTLPTLIDALPNGHVIRAWVTACSTGEEAYSLAILFKEAMGKVENHKRLTLAIFATDIDKDAIVEARKGYFRKNIVNDVSEERLSAFFTPEGEGFRVNSSIREMIVFAVQNVIKDPPFTRLDIITCRNLFIYMEGELQKKLIYLFNYSLNPGGILLLGTSETMGSKIDEFETLDNKLKIFRSTGKVLLPEAVSFSSALRNTTDTTVDKAPKVVDNIQSLAEQVLIQRFSPASVLVNAAGDIIFITGRTGKYLEPVAGKANMNIYAMAREGLANELPGAFHKAMQSFDPVIRRNIKVGINGGSQIIDLTVQRLERPDALKGMIIVVFRGLSSCLKM